MKTSTIKHFLHTLRIRSLAQDADYNVFPIVPQLFMDISYQYFGKLKDVKMRGELKYRFKIWRDAINDYFKSFFCVWTDEQQEEVIELMDSLESYIHNEIVMYRLALIRAINHPDDEVKYRIADIYIAIAMILNAKYTYSAVFKRVVDKDLQISIRQRSASLDKIWSASVNFLKYYEFTCGALESKTSEELERLQSAVGIKAIQWAENQTLTD